MAIDESVKSVAPQNAKSTGNDVDPRDTDHPTGAQQAAENAADESPS